eukprot:Nitzschia sp. Nitz4//scaffold58_size112336//109297//109609//NITZ4_004054-RA/size112336-augustus-gene-0.26-mRNA-1//-1//CDS//3329555052//5788//frame0
MNLSLWNLFKVGLLMVNSVMILNRKRFLAKYQLDDLMAAAGDPVKEQVVGLLHAVQYLKVPVVAGNVLTIFLEIFLGG